jgi:mannosyl-oligosaccharide alpha-1,2-mannosidase
VNDTFTGYDEPSSTQLEFYKKHGFYILSSYHIMRPEVLESNFYAWRATGDIKYYDRAAQALSSFERYLKAADSYAMLVDVNDNSRNPQNFYDDMESFWFAETLKYL